MKNEEARHEVHEGLARLIISGKPRRKGPGKKTGVPFYNPAMESNRDMSVLFLRSLRRPGLRVLDGLSASGAFGVRVALEVPEVKVTCNDRDQDAVELLKLNAERNNVRFEAVHCGRLQTLLHAERFDVVDIDPFGTPVPFLDSALQSVIREGLLSVTATDTAVLCGAQRNACLRRYEAMPLNVDCCKEIALRILIGHCARVAMKHDRAVTPLLTFSSDHYLRVFLRVINSPQEAEKSRESIGYINYDKESGDRWLSAERARDTDWAGPLWAGPMLDGETVGGLAPLRYMGHETSMLVDALRKEVGAPALYVTTSFLSGFLKHATPPLRRFIENLRSKGFTALRTHFDLEGVKTDAKWDDIASTFRE